MKSLSCGLAALALLLTALGPAENARAGTIIYREEASASGSLGGIPFTNADIVMQMSGDTENAFFDGIANWLNFGTTTVTVPGIGTATFTDANTGVFATPSQGLAGFTNEFAINLATVNPAFASYDLKSAIGPITGSTVGSFFGTGDTTTLGEFVFSTSDPPATATFTAQVVPEPASWGLLGLGGLGLAIEAFCKRRRSSSVQKGAIRGHP
jgi:hypothetical protein